MSRLRRICRASTGQTPPPPGEESLSAFLAINALFGAGAGGVFALALLFTDCFGLHTVLMHDDVPWFSTIVFVCGACLLFCPIGIAAGLSVLDRE